MNEISKIWKNKNSVLNVCLHLQSNNEQLKKIGIELTIV